MTPITVWRSGERFGVWLPSRDEWKKVRDKVVTENQVYRGGDRAKFALVDPSDELWQMIRKSSDWKPVNKALEPEPKKDDDKPKPRR